MGRPRSFSEPDLERQQLRRSVRRLAAARAECDDCGRSPLTGEELHRFGDGAEVCTLCAATHRGAPTASRIVRQEPCGGTVVRLRAA